MNTICVPLPRVGPHHTVDLDVTVDGVLHSTQYRVETAPWPSGMNTEARVDGLRNFILAHLPEWELVQIGPPEVECVPVTFRRHVRTGSRPC